MLNDLLLNNDPCDRGLGGIFEMQFIPRVAVESMGIPSGLSFTGPLTLKSGWRWYKLEMMDNTCFYTENYRDTPNGDLYDTAIGGFFPKDDLATLELLERMAKYYFLVRVRDYQGRWRIVGNMNETLKLQKRAYSSTTYENRVGFLIEFSGAFMRSGLIDNRA
jgi:hypothetical protein